MNLKQLREKLWWSLDNGQNADDLEFLYSGNDTKLINEALRDLADALHIIQYDNALIPVGSIVTLPGDFMEMLLFKYGDTNLSPITNINDAAIDSGAVVQFMMVDRNKLQLFDTPLAPPEQIFVWYKAYPPELVNDDDVPESVPPEFREALATVYARAQFFKKLGNTNEYAALMALWGVIKRSLKGTIDVKINPVTSQDSWEW